MNKKLIVLLVLIGCTTMVSAQSDTIFLKGNQIIVCNKITETTDQYKFLYRNINNEFTKGSVLKYLVDSVKKDTVGFTKKNQIKKVAPIISSDDNSTTPATTPSWHKTLSIGANIGNLLEFNNISGPDKKSLSFNIAVDASCNYDKENAAVAATNEIHYLFGIQKQGLAPGSFIQKLQDEFTSLHDVSLKFKNNNKWNFNIIVKNTTSFFTTYNGNYFKDVTATGKIQAMASPFEVVVAPGIKYQPNKNIRLSISPYSFQLYGIQSNQVASQGIYITDVDAAGNFKKFLFNRLGAEVNFWYDKKVKQWLDMQYRLSVSSNYLEKIGKNGLLNGLFITKIKMVKDVYLSHRLTIKSNLAVNFWKPYFNQMVLISYAKSF